MKAVILAAGEGKRLQPLTSTRSKHMIPIAGKPILEHLLLAVKESGVKDILIITSYCEDLIRNHFGDGSGLGLNLDYSHQEKPLGSAHAIGLAEEYMKDSNFLVMYGDLLVDASVIKSTIKKHMEEGTPILCVVPVEKPQEYGIVILSEDRVMEVLEKPESKAYGNLANAGVYVFTKEVFNEIKKTPKSPRGEIEITDTIQGMLRRDFEITSNTIRPEDWMDIGRPWDLLDANMRVLGRLCLDIRGEVEEDVHMKGNVHLEEDAKLRSGAYVEGPVFIGRGSDVGPNCHIRPFTSLGGEARIGNGCEVKNSLIQDGTHIGHLSYIGDSIVGANCNLGAGTITANLRFDEKSIRVRVKGEIVDSGKRKLGVIMGDKVETGIGVRFMPGVKVGSGSWIGPSVTVYEDVPPETFLVQRQELEHQRRRDQLQQ